jgi:hypothetical protein
MTRLATRNRRGGISLSRLRAGKKDEGLVFFIIDEGEEKKCDSKNYNNPQPYMFAV